MTVLEERLRAELSQLADALSSDERPEQPIPLFLDREFDQDTLVLESPSRRRWFVAAAAVAVVAVAALGMVLRDAGGRPELATQSSSRERPSAPSTTEVNPSTLGPLGFGTWALLPDAPMRPRALAATAWTGTEAVFWAGSSRPRGVVYADGAAYDPGTGTWRSMVVPGWGHPALTSAFFDGELYAVAKGRATRFDPVNGTWAELAPVAGMFLAAPVASDDAIWGLGPVSQASIDQSDLAIARYEPNTDTWAYGPVFEGASEQVSIVEGLAQLEPSAFWDGSEIVVWGGLAGGLAFDPANETWRVLDAPEPPSGKAESSVAFTTDAGFGVLVEVVTPDGSASSVAVLEPDGWRWLDVAVPIREFESVTIAAAPDWLMIFSAGQSPVSVHLPSGVWSSHDDGPLGDLEAPNVVWTGDRLVIWGRAVSDAVSIWGEEPNDSVPDGATWTPPID